MSTKAAPAAADALIENAQAEETSKTKSEKIEKYVGYGALFIAFVLFVFIFTVSWWMKVILGFGMLVLLGVFIVSLQDDKTQADIFDFFS